MNPFILVYYFVMAPVQPSTISTNVMYYEPTFFFLEINVKCNCDILSIYAVTFFPYNNKSQIEKKNSIIIQKLSLIKIQTPLLSLHTCPANSCSFPESHTFNVLLLFSALSLPTNSRG